MKIKTQNSIAICRREVKTINAVGIAIYEVYISMHYA